MPIRDVTDREHAVELGMQLHAKLREPYQLASVTGHLGISIDAAFFPDNAIIPEVLLAYTDTAIYTMRKKINASLLELVRASGDAEFNDEPEGVGVRHQTAIKSTLLQSAEA